MVTSTLNRSLSTLPTLLGLLAGQRYSFTAVTPETCARVNRRPQNAWARDLRGVLGWSRPFRSGVVPEEVVRAMNEAGVLQHDGDACRSRIRVSSLGGALFAHSAFPTVKPDSVFFGPDTYRTADAALAVLWARAAAPQRMADVGCGSGAVGITLAREMPDAEGVLIDVNERALELAAANAAAAGAARVQTVRSDLARQATLDEYRDLLINRSVYQLKEADPHTFAIPRISGAAKAALVEIQADEYGGGRPEWVHATLFARTMRALGLVPRYGFYLDQVSAPSLASLNAITMFGLHRRLRAAVAGHLAVLEMTSTLPNRLYAQGLRRLGLGDDAALHFDEHVEADAVHEQIALDDLVGELVAAEPECADDVLFGAATAVALDTVVTDHLPETWAAAKAVPVA